MKINICALSDIGKERTNNEDAYSFCSDLGRQIWDNSTKNEYAILSPFGAVSIIADGMGGANSGEIAAGLAIENMRKSFKSANYEKIICSDDAIYSFLGDCITQSNKAILNYARHHPDSIGLGTTIVLLWIIGEKAYIVWCGDSRCYCFNPNYGLKLLTRDHSLVQELVDKGKLKAEDTFNHPDNNIVTRCLGDVGADPKPEFQTYKVNEGDIFLLCSDGLCGYCRDKNIENVMYKCYDNIDGCQHSLLQLALEAGGQDNISISLCATQHERHKNHVISLISKMKRFILKFTNKD